MKTQQMDYYSSKSFGKLDQKVVFFFTALGTRYWLYYPTIRAYRKAGYHIIVYDTSPKIIFDENLFKFLETGLAISQEVKADIATLKKQGITKFYTHGTSMGTLYAMRSAIDTKEISKVIINTTYGSLADNIWSWIVLRKIKMRLIKAGITKQQIDTILEPISPIPMARKLKGKKILLYLAKKDKVMLHEHSIQFKQALDKADVDYMYIENTHFGHNINLIRNNLRSKIYLDFLENPS